MNINDKLSLNGFMWKITHSINELIEIEHKFEEINNLVQLSPSENSVLQFDDKFIKESNDNTESYQILYCLENDLREKIRECLSSEFNWFDAPEFTHLKTQINERKNNESKTKILMRDDDDLVYMTLPELKDVILKKWNKFEENGMFRSKQYIDRILTDINKCRIIIAHNSKLEEIDKSQLKLNLQYYYKQN